MVSDQIRALSEAAITDLARPKSNGNPSNSRIVDIFVDVVHLEREPAALAEHALAVVRADMARDATSILTIDRLTRFELRNIP